MLLPTKKEARRGHVAAVLCLLPALMAGCATRNVESEPSAVESPRWQRARHDDFTVLYAAGLGADERFISRLASSAIERLERRFVARDASPGRPRFRLTIYVHALPTHEAATGRATIVTTRTDDRIQAELHLLAPSMHPKGATTIAGLPFDDAYYAKLITHEIATIFLEYATEEKPSGWSLYDAPAWFVQGYEEYLGLTLSAPAAEGIFRRYVEQAAGEPDRVTLDLHARNDYVDGALMLRFLQAAYGAKAISGILSSPAPTFWQALHEETGLDPVAFKRAFDAWLPACAKQPASEGCALESSAAEH